MHPDSGKSGGFFHKVMHMVRGSSNAATHQPPDTDSLSAREVLQETALRKRRNDAIRQQEFAQLRLLRQRPSSNISEPLHAQSPEDDLSSDFGHITRSSETLLKIDSIEAQMSGQWWRQPGATGKPDAASAARGPTHSPPCDVPVLHDAVQIEPVEVAWPLVSSTASESAAKAAPSALPIVEPHADLEEAAILFAHGDVDAARARLLEQLLQALAGSPIDERLVIALWHAALDACRATGDEAAFEPMAIDYAEHSGRSAPPWFSMPARLGLPAFSGSSLPAVRRAFQWASPAMLTVGAVAALQMAQAQAPQPWSMSWQRLACVDEAALQPLADLFNGWAESTGQFAVSDAAPLLDLVAAQTVAGNAQVSAAWWLLRMALLHFMGEQDAYEQVALDYCITYEVSPPQWQRPNAQCVLEPEGPADISVLPRNSVLHGGSASPSVASVLLPDGYSLAGVLEGDVQPWLDAITDKAQRGQLLLVRCENLIRLDFVAAGSVLNWAAEMQGQGFALRFTDVHLLVAAFFHVIGIHEHAQLHTTRV